MIIPTNNGLPDPDLGKWRPHLRHVLHEPKFCDLATYLSWRESLDDVEIYPPAENVFNALHSTPPESVKVVILGQDPYHGEGQAHGLSFSVQKGQKIPPSLKNIYQEMKDDLGVVPPDHGYLQSWANEGVLLLNTLLTVEKSSPMAHKGKGWEIFTDAVIKAVSDTSETSVFILWGDPSRKKKKLIDAGKHLIIEGPHPSPLSAYRGFFGSKPFSKANKWLESHGRTPIEWKI